MSHEIIGFNKKGEEIAYVRFTMNDYYAHIVYDLFDAHEHNGGPSGRGYTEVYSLQQVQKAFNSFNTLTNELSEVIDFESTPWQLDHIFKFLHRCLFTAENEKSISICYC